MILLSKKGAFMVRPNHFEREERLGPSHGKKTKFWRDFGIHGGSFSSGRPTNRGHELQGCLAPRAPRLMLGGEIGTIGGHPRHPKLVVMLHFLTLNPSSTHGVGLEEGP